MYRSVYEVYCSVAVVWGGFPGTLPDSKVPGANMGPIWGRQNPGGPRVGPMNFAIWAVVLSSLCDLALGLVVPY